jgi:2'-5' RNA ligase
MEGRARLFVALGLGPELGPRALAPVAEALAGGPWKLPRAEGLHLTLLFLGDQPRARLPELARAFADALEGAPRPHLVLDGAGGFPRRGDERVLWLGAREEPPGSGRLAELHRRTLAAAAGAGLDLKDELGRPFRPHVTVARPRGRRGRAPEAFHALALELAFEPAEAVLFESVAGGGAPLYAPRALFPLAT